MYMGTTLTGKLGVPAQPVIIGNEWVPVPSELNQDYHGPGFKLDFPNNAGNCAYCHAPAAIPASQQNAELRGLFPTPGGVSGEGVTCDVCHKTFDVILADNGFPFTDRPGVLSFRFLRPNSGVFMLGPFSNMLSMKNGEATNHRLACTPLYSQSEFCAPCHFGKFGDMVIYNSYGEWKASPYAANPGDPSYRTCQDCHMSHMDVNDTSSLWAQRRACYGSDARFQNFDHNMMNFGMDATGKEIPRMVQNAADIRVNVASQPTGSNALDVLVNVTNVRAGHNFPTDSPLRHLILVVRVEDRVGTALIQVGGGQIPKWAGPRLGSNQNYVQILRNVGVENYSGLPGKIFANLLVEEETNLSPGMAYWNETKSAFVNAASQVSSDNRLRPRATDASTYSFAMPDAGDVKVIVKLIYRFAFYDLLLQKEWFDRPDIIVTQVECYGPPRQPEILMQSCRQVAP
jgi:nitrate/TMAO reductase-like tetraheme cytochrome c subunit